MNHLPNQTFLLHGCPLQRLPLSWFPWSAEVEEVGVPVSLQTVLGKVEVGQRCGEKAHINNVSCYVSLMCQSSWNACEGQLTSSSQTSKKPPLYLGEHQLVDRSLRDRAASPKALSTGLPAFCDKIVLGSRDRIKWSSFTNRKGPQTTFQNHNPGL